MPLLTLSTRNEIALPLGSDSFAAPARVAYEIENHVSSVAFVKVEIVVSVGATFTAFITWTMIGTGVEDTCDPSDATTVNAFTKPLASAEGVHTQVSFVLSRVEPAMTLVPFFVNVPFTDSTRKEIASPSASVSFAAAASAA